MAEAEQEEFNPYFTTNSTYGKYFPGVVGEKTCSIPPPIEEAEGENYFEKTLAMKQTRRTNQPPQPNLENTEEQEAQMKETEKNIMQFHTTFQPNDNYTDKKTHPYSKGFKDNMYVYQSSFSPCYTYPDELMGGTEFVNQNMNTNSQGRKTFDKVKVFFIVGGPGSGKGTQCAKIKQNFNFEHISTGDVLRNIVKEKKHPKWKELDEKMKSGGFVKSSELIGFVKDEFTKYQGKKLLLDGFPRNQENVDEWNKQMNDVAEVKAVLYFETSADTMIKRMCGRNEGRADDKPEIMKKRIENFIKDSIPVVGVYEKQGLVIRINAERNKDEIFADVERKLRERNLI